MAEELTTVVYVPAPGEGPEPKRLSEPFRYTVTPHRPWKTSAAHAKLLKEHFPKQIQVTPAPEPPAPSPTPAPPEKSQDKQPEKAPQTPGPSPIKEGESK